MVARAYLKLLAWQQPSAIYLCGADYLGVVHGEEKKEGGKTETTKTASTTPTHKTPTHSEIYKPN